MRVARSTLWRLGRFSTSGRKPSQLTPADVKKVETAKRLRKEVANIEIPIMQETQTQKLSELIEQRRREIQESNALAHAPQEFNLFMGLLSLPKAIAIGAVIVVQAFDYSSILVVLHQAVLNYGHLTVFTLSGLDLAAVLIGHSLSLNTVTTTSKNWMRLAYCVVPCAISTALMAMGYCGLPTIEYFAAYYLIALMGRNLYAAELPQWLRKARFHFLLRCAAFIVMYRLYATFKPEEDLMRKREYWPSLTPTSDATLKLSDIKPSK